MTLAKAHDACASNPDAEGTHECMVGERRCVWCSQAMEAYGCHGCNEFLTAEEMHSAAMDGVWRCRDCA